MIRELSFRLRAAGALPIALAASWLASPAASATLADLAGTWVAEHPRAGHVGVVLRVDEKDVTLLERLRSRAGECVLTASAAGGTNGKVASVTFNRFTALCSGPSPQPLTVHLEECNFATTGTEPARLSVTCVKANGGGPVVLRRSP